MTAAQLLSNLRERGITVSRDRQNLRLRAPNGAITADIQDLVKRHKLELLELLHEERIRQQLAALVEYQTEDGRVVLVHPRYQKELDELGLL